MNESSTQERLDSSTELRRENAEYQSMCLLLYDEVDRLMREATADQEYHYDKMRIKQDHIDLLEERAVKMQQQLVSARQKLQFARYNAEYIKVELATIWYLIRHVRIVTQMPLEISPVAEKIIGNLAGFENFVQLTNSETECAKLRDITKQQDRRIRKLKQEIDKLKGESMLGRRSSKQQTQSFSRNDSILPKDDSLISWKTEKLETQLIETKQRCAELDSELSLLRKNIYANESPKSNNPPSLPAYNAQNANLVDFTYYTTFDVDYARMQALEFEAQMSKHEILLLNQRIIQLQQENYYLNSDFAEYKLTQVKDFGWSAREYAEARARYEQAISELKYTLEERDVQISQMMRRSKTESQIELSFQVYYLQYQLAQRDSDIAAITADVEEKKLIIERQKQRLDSVDATQAELTESVHINADRAEYLQILVDAVVHHMPELKEAPVTTWTAFFDKVARQNTQFNRVFAEKEDAVAAQHLAEKELSYREHEIQFLTKQMQRLKEADQSMRSVVQFKARQLEQLEHRAGIAEIERDEFRNKLTALQAEHTHYRKMQAQAFDNIKAYYEGFHAEITAQISALKRENARLKRPIAIKAALTTAEAASQASDDDAKRMAALERTNQHLLSQLENERKMAKSTRSCLQATENKSAAAVPPRTAFQRDLHSIFSVKQVVQRFEHLAINVDIVMDVKLSSAVRLASAVAFFKDLEKTLR